MIDNTTQQIGRLASEIEQCQTELAFIAGAHISAQQMSDQLLPVTDPQHRNTGLQNLRLNGGAGIAINTAGTA